MGDLNSQFAAANGVVNITDNTAHTGDWFALQVVGENPITFSTFTETDASGSLAGVALPPGTIIYNGKGITALTRSGETGQARAYRR